MNQIDRLMNRIGILGNGAKAITNMPGFNIKLLFFLILTPGLGYAKSVGPMVYIYNAPESSLDTRYLYQWKILETALEKTISKYGPYDMRVSEEVMSESRQAREMIQNSGKLTVIYLDTSPELEKKLFPVRIPVDKSLVGYRVLLIRKSDRKKFAAITSLSQLQELDLGQGLGWIDVKILQANGFNVVTGSSYEGLFDMLVHERFDAFPRGTTEVLDEYNARKKMMPELYIEPTILLYYPLPMYFWFADTEEGRKLEARAEEGMWMMIEDGSYDRIFDEYHHDNIRRLKLGQRKVFRLDNPLLVPDTPLADKRLWFDLDSYMKKH